MKEHVRLDFACNDPDNGNFAGCVAQINVPAAEADLTARNWEITSTRGLPKLRIDGAHIVLSGKRWPVLGSKGWVGNWCWDAWFFSPRVGWAFLHWLHGRRLFQCDGGETWFCELWNSESFPSTPDEGFLVRWQEARIR